MNGFTKKYNVNKLVYYERTTDIHAALAREKKNNLVMTMNPEWKDLSLEWQGEKISC